MQSIQARIGEANDMAESLVGDLTPADRVPKTEKGRRESMTIDYITKQLTGNVRSVTTNVGDEIRAIWQEHEDSETLESRFVQDVDKVELHLQNLKALSNQTPNIHGCWRNDNQSSLMGSQEVTPTTSFTQTNERGYKKPSCGGQVLKCQKHSFEQELNDDKENENDRDDGGLI